MGFYQSRRRPVRAPRSSGDSYKMDLQGTTKTFGVSYTEHVVLEKLQKSGNAQGKWKLTGFEQTIMYPQPVNFSINKVDHHDLGHGMCMDGHTKDWAKPGKQWK